jgi:hypothetical protein
MSTPQKFYREHHLPAAMQGAWVGVDDQAERLTVDGFDVIYADRAVGHDYFTVEEIDGAVAVQLWIDDESRIDAFAGANVTDLVIDPDGQFHASNVNFASTFEKQA